jgi:hypothetical protein
MMFALFGHRTPYFNFFAMDEMDLSFKRFDGLKQPRCDPCGVQKC